MSDFSSEIRRRVSDARQLVVEALASEDDYLAQIRQQELDDVTRLAVEHQVAVDRVD